MLFLVGNQMSHEMWIARDDWYVFYDAKPIADILGTNIEEQWHTKVELSDEEYADFQRVAEEYSLWQDKLQLLVFNIKGTI